MDVRIAPQTDLLGEETPPPSQAVSTAKHDIVPAHLAVQAMRDNGYKNAAYALAELMDNSIQAGATRVELLCGERDVMIQQRRRSRIDQIAVLDDGCGMDEAVLRMALQFGNGTRLSPQKQDGIGKFGMGLPSSSISQAARVDVWSWKDGPESAQHSYLDVDEIREARMREVPIPQPRPIPHTWRSVGKGFGNSGTLVVWSQLDRVIWKSARSIIENSEMLIGRMYRKFLVDGRVSIRMVSFNMEHLARDLKEQYALPNDPLYLMRGTSCPAPFDEGPMFQLWEEPWVMNVRHKGEVHPVTVTFSVAREEARLTPNAGSTPHGRHAAKNIGVSVVRAGRELDLEQSWTLQYDPRERWWGIEVEFPPALDDLFGVSNNKQSARNFHEVDPESLLHEGETIAQMKERLEEEEDPLGPLLEISHRIDENLSIIRKLIDQQRKGERNSRRRYEDHEAEQIATTKTEARKSDGYHGESDDGEALPPEQRTQEIRDELVRVGLPEQVAQGIAASTVDNGFKYTIVEAPLEGSAFFSVSIKSGAVIVNLNMNHPAYGALLEALDASEDALQDAEALAKRLQNARNGLRLLLMAWARYEDELPSQRRTQAQDVRADWGRIARQFMEA